MTQVNGKRKRAQRAARIEINHISDSLNVTWGVPSLRTLFPALFEKRVSVSDHCGQRTTQERLKQ